MTNSAIFPPLVNWEATRDTLHAYTKAVSAITRAHAISHPLWWQISFKFRPEGLVTDEIALPRGGSLHLKMDWQSHQVALITDRGVQQTWSLLAGWTASRLAQGLIDAVAELGLQGKYARQIFENDDPHPYDPGQAETYFSLLVVLDRILKKRHASLDGVVGPVQLWPHNFDLAFEWFGNRMIEPGDGRPAVGKPPQINFGFSPGDQTHPAAYFYSNPWPFDAEKWGQPPLPHGARWFTESWKGTLLEYSPLVADPEAEQKLLDYADAVYKICSPHLGIWTELP